MIDFIRDGGAIVPMTPKEKLAVAIKWAKPLKNTVKAVTIKTKPGRDK